MLKKVGVNGQITIPKEFMKKLGLHSGDLMDIHIESSNIIMEPKVAISKNQTYFPAPDWQKKSE